MGPRYYSLHRFNLNKRLLFQKYKWSIELNTLIKSTVNRENKQLTLLDLNTLPSPFREMQVTDIYIYNPTNAFFTMRTKPRLASAGLSGVSHTERNVQVRFPPLFRDSSPCLGTNACTHYRKRLIILKIYIQHHHHSHNVGG